MLTSMSFVCVSLLLLIVSAELDLSKEEVEDVDEELQCSKWERAEIEQYFSSKTPYRAIANKNETAYDYPGCRPTRIWSVIRHGARNPSKDDINGAHTFLTQIREQLLNDSSVQLCDEELVRLRSWSFNVTADEEKYLVAEGENELIELAERMQKRFPELLPETYDPQLYYFKYTATQRTYKSANSFATGLFGRDNIKAINYPEPSKKDPVLRGTADCVQKLPHAKNMLQSMYKL